MQIFTSQKSKKKNSNNHVEYLVNLTIKPSTFLCLVLSQSIDEHTALLIDCKCDE